MAFNTSTVANPLNRKTDTPARPGAELRAKIVSLLKAVMKAACIDPFAFRKALIRALEMRYLLCFLCLCLSLASCSVQPPKLDGKLPPLKKQLECLPPETALISAHRGTAKGTKYAENSIEALKTLINKGYLMAEIDIARLKDDTHILYHDGIWDKGSTGRGPVSSTTWLEAEKLILKDTQGRFTSHQVPKLKDYLSIASDRIYLEIDFKSSANYEHVINQIRQYKMADLVILISYNKGQAKKLSKLAPDMMISISTQKSRDTMGYPKGQAAAWVGNAITDENLIRKLKDAEIPILGKIGYGWNATKAEAAHILVTDYALEHRPITGLTSANRKNYKACLDR